MLLYTSPWGAFWRQGFLDLGSFVSKYHQPFHVCSKVLIFYTKTYNFMNNLITLYRIMTPFNASRIEVFKKIEWKKSLVLDHMCELHRLKKNDAQIYVPIRPRTYDKNLLNLLKSSIPEISSSTSTIFSVETL